MNIDASRRAYPAHFERPLRWRVQWLEEHDCNHKGPFCLYGWDILTAVVREKELRKLLSDENLILVRVTPLKGRT